jgi:hypothetical protein
MQAPSKRASTKTTAQLFKKQRLRLNPTFAQEQHTNNTNTHSPNEPNLEDDDHVSLSHGSDDYESGSSLLDDDSIASEESFGSAESVGNYGCADRPESPVESEYSCFTTGQMCVMSLMYLLDDMECPDYAFKAIMDWARKCFEAGFDFNPKCKTRLGNLNWMYDALHNAEQMLPHLESIELPEPLPNVTTMNVICYDFVPQLLSILQNKKMMSANNLLRLTHCLGLVWNPFCLHLLCCRMPHAARRMHGDHLDMCSSLRAICDLTNANYPPVPRQETTMHSCKPCYKACNVFRQVLTQDYKMLRSICLTNVCRLICCVLFY